LNEAAGRRHTVCFNRVDWSRGQERRFGQAAADAKKSEATPTQACGVARIFPPRSGFVQVGFLKFRRRSVTRATFSNFYHKSLFHKDKNPSDRIFHDCYQLF
jgi:hypothetical protein